MSRPDPTLVDPPCPHRRAVKENARGECRGCQEKGQPPQQYVVYGCTYKGACIIPDCVKCPKKNEGQS